MLILWIVLAGGVLVSCFLAVYFLCFRKPKETEVTDNSVDPSQILEILSGAEPHLSSMLVDTDLNPDQIEKLKDVIEYIDRLYILAGSAPFSEKFPLKDSVPDSSREFDDSLSFQDRAFIAKFYEVMENNLGVVNCDVSVFADELHMSRTNLYYRVKNLTGASPAAFFKVYKMNRSAELIRSGKYNFSEISDRMGFASLSHFSSSFKKQFGVSPTDYLKLSKK